MARQDRWSGLQKPDPSGVLPASADDALPAQVLPVSAGQKAFPLVGIDGHAFAQAAGGDDPVRYLQESGQRCQDHATGESNT